MHLFYLPETSSGEILLDEEESRHCSKVLRLSEGDTIHITDGKGNLFECAIVDASIKKCRLKVLLKKEKNQQRNTLLHIAIAPTKNIDRFEWFLEKSTEIGIDFITPVFCQHSERTHLKTERLEKVIISAMKQSLKAYLPQLYQPIDFKSFIHQPFNGLKLIGYCDLPETENIEKVCSKGTDVLMMIGPEGDFSKEEIELAKNEEFIPISLGKSRLRTETAGVVACTIINFLNH